MSEQSGERAASLTALECDLAELDEEASALDTAVVDEIGGAGRTRTPWSAALQVLAENVMPLSLKDDTGSPAERRLAAVRRRGVRLLREAAVLRERTDALRTQMAWLRQQSLDVGHKGAALRSWSANAERYRTDIRKWADELVLYQRRLRWLRERSRGAGRGGDALTRRGHK